MKIQIRRVDKSLPLPSYGTEGASAIDLYSRITMEVEPKSLALIPTNIIVGTPLGYAFIVASRSGTPKKKGLLIPHGFGIIDSDYRGPDDEVMMQVFNFTDQAVSIEKGERIGQGFFIEVGHIEWEEVEGFNASTRGGFGSSG